MTELTQADLFYIDKVIRKERNQRLAECDWTQVDDCPLKGNPKWLEYRQALRDITTHPNLPTLVEADWPIKPE